jgi:hypothetical protein
MRGIMSWLTSTHARQEYVIAMPACGGNLRAMASVSGVRCLGGSASAPPMALRLPICRRLPPSSR